MAVIARITLFMNHGPSSLTTGGHRTLVNPSSVEFLSIACGRANNLPRPMDSLGEQTTRVAAASRLSQALSVRAETIGDR